MVLTAPSCHINCLLHKQRDRRHETNVCTTNTAHLGRDRRPLGFVYLNAGLLAGSQYASRSYCDRPFRYRCCGKCQRIPKFRVELRAFYVAVCSWCQSDTKTILTRVGTLIVATIYLQMIQNRYMFRGFTVLQCSHQHCVQPVASDVEVVGYL